MEEREPSPVGPRPSLSLGPTRSSGAVTRYVYGGAPLKSLGGVIMGFDGDTAGRPPPGTDAARILEEYDLGPRERAQLHVFPTPGLALQALRNGDRKHVFGEILFRCGEQRGEGGHPEFVVSKKYLPSRPLPPDAANDLFTYVAEYPQETRDLWPQLWAQLLAVGAALHQGERGIVHHDIKPENLVVETWQRDPPRCACASSILSTRTPSPRAPPPTPCTRWPPCRSRRSCRRACIVSCLRTSR